MEKPTIRRDKKDQCFAYLQRSLDELEVRKMTGKVVLELDLHMGAVNAAELCVKERFLRRK